MIPPRGMIHFWTLILQFQFVCEQVLRLLVKPMADKSKTIFSTTPARVNAFLKRIEAKHDLAQYIKALHLYRFRHVGPSVAAAAGLMDQGSIMRMRRWKSLKALRRYEKGGQVAQVLAVFPEHLGVTGAVQKLRQLLLALEDAE